MDQQELRSEREAKYPYSMPDEYRAWWESQTDVPYGYCWCGCGERTSVALRNLRSQGMIKDEPRRYRNNHHSRGSSHPQWKGGRYKDDLGYIKVKAGWHPFCNPRGYVYEHRLVMEDLLDRFLWPWELVHHTPDPDKTNNAPDNLQLETRRSHASLHQDTPYLLEEIDAMHRAGMSYAALGRKYGRHKTTIMEALKRHRASLET